MAWKDTLAAIQGADADADVPALLEQLQGEGEAREAYVTTLANTVETQKSEILTVKAKNYELLMSLPSTDEIFMPSDDDDEPETVLTIDSLFKTNEGK